MDLTEFDALAEPLLRESAESVARWGFALIEGRTSTPEEIARAEDRMGVTFPDKYKAFMTRHGGGQFGFVELLPLVDPDRPGENDVWTENNTWFPDRDFVAVAEVGTGDYWGFPVADGRCREQIWFHFHDGYERELVAADFLEFIAEYALKSPSDRALERRSQ
ncbi:SMI1/KNR4 family protein [Dactylosporangium sp. NPDC000521]|uniref:SMI1/KNR4 family protein n=1 Tax=Dactylosporangium sp. NPDC000521 TaxID=3363975 RepID=UPI0036867E82